MQDEIEINTLKKYLNIALAELYFIKLDSMSQKKIKPKNIDNVIKNLQDLGKTIKLVN